MAEILEYAQSQFSQILARLRQIDYQDLGLALLTLVVATFLLWGAVRLLRITMRVLADKASTFGTSQIGAVRFQRQELLSADDLGRLAHGLVTGIHWAALLVVSYFYVSLVLGLFPWTRHLAAILVQAIVSTLLLVGTTVIEYVPSLLIIGCVLLLTRYVVKLAGLVFNGIETGRIRVHGFYKEWARPTFNMVRILLFGLAVVVVFPYLPGSGSPAFQGVSIFVGVLLSLGSSSAVANVVAGVVITYMRAFQIGDRVQIAETNGDVVEKSMLVTKIRTVKNVDITIPNAMVLSNHIINYSSFAKRQGVVLHTSITIGYDVPWRDVHALMIKAAAEVDGVEADPAPFVLQKSLDDFYVSYELNVHTRAARMMASIYSQIHKNIQDVFNEAGVEIMSSHYSAVRDGNETTIPAAHRPRGYQAPGFRMDPLSKILNPEG